jgi:predicted house-cleaning noncanonical NTP pyrophosphatase (MazG superfamily)
VELEGSILSHAYYVLRRQHVRVLCVDALEEPERSKRYQKLVRDKVPLRIFAHGEEAKTVRVARSQLLDLLKAKAVEESLELFWEDRGDAMLEELADLIEVIDSMAHIAGSSFEDVAELAKRKREERGGFAQGIVLLATRSVPLLRRELRDAGLFPEANSQEDAQPRRATGTSTAMFDGWRRPRSDGAAVTIPLVPPPTARGGRELTLALADGRYELRIRYSRNSARVMLQRRNRSADDPRQLRLKFP